MTDAWRGEQALIWYSENVGGEILLGHAGMNFGVHAGMCFAPDHCVGVIMLGNRYLGNRRAWNRWLAIQTRLFEQA